MSRIFISYRREDSIAYAGRLYDRLAEKFGEENIFMDLDSMKLGRDFVEQIDQAVQACDVLIAVIGKGWLTAKNEEEMRRLDNPEDWVRLEIKAALDRDIPVVPLLVGGADIPKASDLPDALVKLARRHAMKMSDERFRTDATRLIEQISEYVKGDSPAPSPKKPSQIPDDMVLIPKGPFLYGEGRIKENITYDFWLDIQPVTNRQFAQFLQGGGYEKEAYWSQEGWQWRTGEGVNNPEYWDDKKFNRPDQPVVGVNYYEAEAYAKWAGKRLPTEYEWEKGARGTDGRIYPWGEEFEADLCACSVKGKRNGPAPIGTFPEGQSPYGCQDMAGNVWEWTDSWMSGVEAKEVWKNYGYDPSKSGIEDQAHYRVLRGGSCGGGNPEHFRCAFRLINFNPRIRNFNIGFRCAQDVP